MPKLDGTETHKDLLTPFDAHEQMVRATHTHDAAEGYQAAEYEHQEFPKAVAHDPETGEPIIANNEKEERKLSSSSYRDLQKRVEGSVGRLADKLAGRREGLKTEEE